MPTLEPVEGNPFEPKDDWVPVAQAEPKDDWAAFKPEAAIQNDAWASFKPEAAPPAMPPLTGAEPSPLPQPFIDRLSRGMAVNRILQKAVEGFKDGLGSEPSTGVSDETRQQMYDIGLLHDPTKGPAGPIHLLNDFALVQTPKAFETLMRGVNAGLHGAAGTMGQLIDELRGEPEDVGGAGSQAKREIINAGNWAMIEAGMGRFIRPGAAADHEIGTLPRDVDFQNAAEVIAPSKGGLRLEPAPEGGIYTPKEIKPNEQYFKAIDADGKTSAEMLVSFDGSKATVEDILNPSEIRSAGRSTIGARDLRDLLRQFQEQHPEIDSIGGKRLSGARFGGDYDPFAEGGQTIEMKLRARWQEQGLHPSEVAHDAQQDAFLRHDLSSAAAEPKDLPPDVPPSVQPLSPPGKIGAAIHAATDKMFDLSRDIQMSVAPMAVGNDIIPKALAKDFANSLRRNSWDMDRWARDIDRRFTVEEQKEAFIRLDEESQWRQSGEPAPSGVGLSALKPELRSEVDKVMAANAADWVQAADMNMVRGEPIPAYAARIAINLDKGDMQGSIPLNSLGLNLKSSTSRTMQRKYLTVEETEAALKKQYPEAEISRNIKANILAMKQTRDAIAGRKLVESAKEYGRKIGTDQVAEGFKPSNEYFTIDHPAMKTWRPQLEKLDDGTWATIKNEAGETQMEQVPIYIHKDWEGPLRAVLSQKHGEIANALMMAKSKAMSLIMYSPFIHNSVIYSKALAGFNGNPIKTTKMYFDGNRIKNDPAQMIEAIDGGMVPIGKRFFNQDITDQMTSPSLTTGDSLTAKMVSAVPGLFSEGAETAVKKAIDKAGNFYHNTMLWDRVADLQAGVYAHFRDEFVSSGMDRQTAVRMAGHEANRLAGSLPVESMSAGARTVANTILFSRTFTLGNIGIMKDMFTGLPKDVLAQIERDVGPQAKTDAKSLARRQAFATVVTDMALFYVGTSVMQNAVNVILGGSNLPDEALGYWTRLKNELAAKASNPWAAIPPWGIYSFLQNISATGGNEPGKQDRVLLGYGKDGTAIYGKSPMGRIGEEFSDYSQGFWRDLFLRKMGTLARPVWEIMSNDKGFGRKVFDPHIDSAMGAIGAAWEMAKVLVESQLPVTQISAFTKLVKGEGDQKLNMLQTVGPFLPPPFTFTASKGAPGGPAVGQYYDTKSQQDFRVQQAMPGIRQMLQRGDTQGARGEMDRLHMDAGYRRWVEKTTANPALRLSPSGLRKFYQYATPDQRERLENLRTPSPLAPE